jgi:hypothetical protein
VSDAHASSFGGGGAESDVVEPITTCSGYKLYFAGGWEFAVLVTNFIFQKAKLTSFFSRFAANCGYKLYFAITSCGWKIKSVTAKYSL